MLYATLNAAIDEETLLTKVINSFSHLRYTSFSGIQSQLTMGGGGLRILPHKSWNPYSASNRARVRKDEEEHAQRLQKLNKRREEIDDDDYCINDEKK